MRRSRILIYIPIILQLSCGYKLQPPIIKAKKEPLVETIRIEHKTERANIKLKPPQAGRISEIRFTDLVELKRVQGLASYFEDKETQELIDYFIQNEYSHIPHSPELTSIRSQLETEFNYLANHTEYSKQKLRKDLQQIPQDIIESELEREVKRELNKRFVQKREWEGAPWRELPQEVLQELADHYQRQKNNPSSSLMRRIIRKHKRNIIRQLQEEYERQEKKLTLTIIDRELELSSNQTAVDCAEELIQALDYYVPMLERLDRLIAEYKKDPGDVYNTLVGFKNALEVMPDLVQAAEKLDMRPKYVIAHYIRESMFDHYAVSHAGAIRMTQTLASARRSVYTRFKKYDTDFSKIMKELVGTPASPRELTAMMTDSAIDLKVGMLYLKTMFPEENRNLGVFDIRRLDDLRDQVEQVHEYLEIAMEKLQEAERGVPVGDFLTGPSTTLAAQEAKAYLGYVISSIDEINQIFENIDTFAEETGAASKYNSGKYKIPLFTETLRHVTAIPRYWNILNWMDLKLLGFDKISIPELVGNNEN
jgi:hypothetical protein